MTLSEAYFGNDSARVEGCMAEIISVLSESSLWESTVGRSVPTAVLLKALDPRRPPEERISEVLAILQALRLEGRLARWIPWSESLPGYEYANRFYPGYRDHTIHTLQVFLLGMYLLETVSTIREALIPRLQQTIPGAGLGEADLVVEWWLLASLWHDQGYPFEAEAFLADATTREAILERLSQELGGDPFSEALKRLGISIPRPLKRRIYGAARYFPFEIISTSHLLSHQAVQGILDEMWRRLGVGLDVESPVAELDRLTTQAPAGRSPFHDHGLVAAALFLVLADEAMTFLSNLGDVAAAKLGSSGDRIVKVATTEWETFAELEGLVRLAGEAIGFHNISFGQLGASRAGSVLVQPGFRPNISLRAEPHLFFLCLVDTLQDWDRHHFIPNHPFGAYRPSARSSDLLLQGLGGRLRVALHGVEKPVEALHRLFSGWLSEADVEELLDEGPTFTFPGRITAQVPGKLDEVAASRKERKRLQAVIISSCELARAALIEDASDSVIRASMTLESALRQVRDGEALLSFSDREVVQGYLRESGISRLRAQSYALIEPGTRLPLGVVSAQLGEGGFGTVYQVKGDHEDQEPVYAFKLYHERDLEDQEKLRLFRRGYEAMRALNDQPNVVNVFSFSEVPLGFYMAFIPGPNLEDGIDMLDTIHARLRVAVTIAETLAAAHSRPVQVLHRDVKPGNVLLDLSRDSIVPILTDFDLAWIESRHTQLTQQLYANLHYGAPEQFEPRWREFRQRPTVDVYSFGALSYFLLLKQAPPPWHGWKDMHWRFLEETLEGELDAPVVSRLRNLLEAMVRPEPMSRPGRMDSVVTELSRAAALAEAGGGEADRTQWLQQVAYKVTGHSKPYDSGFASRTGRTFWQIAARRSPKAFSVTASVTLLMKPSFEGVDYQGYRVAAARRIDGRLRAFEATWENARAVRSGFPTERSAATLEITGLPCSLESAAAVGELIGQVSRSIE